MNSVTSHPKKWIILAITSVSTFMSTLDGSIVNIALPDMSNQLHVSISSIQWVVTAYLLTISLLLLVCGKLSDLYGKKIIFSSGFVLFACGSALCGFSHSLGILVFSRVIQAIGAAAMMSLSQGIVTAVFSDEERGRALGLVGTMVAIGSLTGPSLGGILDHAFNWQSVFYINIPIGIIGAALSFIIIPEIFETQDNKHFDLKGAVFFSLSILFLFLGLMFVQDDTLPLWALAPALLLSVAAMYIFILIERKSLNPLISLKLFKISEFSFGLVAAFLSFVAINSTLLFMPFYLQNLLGYSPLKAGLVISVYPLMTAFVAPLSGWLSDKLTFRPLAITGMSLSTFALLIMATFNKQTPIWEIIILLIIFGVGLATFQSPNTSSIMGAVGREQLGIAGGINALFRNLGLVSGTAFSVLIFSFATSVNINNMSSGGFNASGFTKGFTIIMIFNAFCTLLAALISIKRSAKAKN
jgi:EmrB/QacA subfamily drug resistance transporter